MLLGIIVAAYWWRVVRMAAKMRRKTGRAANFVPSERVGRWLRMIWQPVVWIWIAHPFISAFLRRPPFLLRPIYHSPLIRWTAVLVALSAFLGSRVCWRRMGKSWRMGIDPQERTALVINGPWAYVRHPIYALSSMMMMATAAAMPTPLMIVVAVIHLLLLQWEASREEQHLLQIHGQQYDQYRGSVGRFFPRTFRAYAQSTTLP